MLYKAVPQMFLYVNLKMMKVAHHPVHIVIVMKKNLNRRYISILWIIMIVHTSNSKLTRFKIIYIKKYGSYIMMTHMTISIYFMLHLILLRVINRNLTFIFMFKIKRTQKIY